jgi:hypothetical protein
MAKSEFLLILKSIARFDFRALTPILDEQKKAARRRPSEGAITQGRVGEGLRGVMILQCRCGAVCQQREELAVGKS